MAVSVLARFHGTCQGFPLHLATFLSLQGKRGSSFYVKHFIQYLFVAAFLGMLACSLSQAINGRGVDTTARDPT